MLKSKVIPILLNESKNNPQIFMPMTHEMPKLPYELDALVPYISEETMTYHFGKHLQPYLDNVNKLIIDTPFEELSLKEIVQKADGAIFNNAAQAWNHILFFKQLTPHPVNMSSHMTQVLANRFGSISHFKQLFQETAIGLFGSGWVWLAIDSKHELQLVATPNAGNPITQNMRPLLCIDVWEHAYYIDYRNQRAAYIKNFWPLIDWNKVEKRMSLEDSVLFF